MSQSIPKQFLASTSLFMGANHDLRDKVDDGACWLLRVVLGKEMAHVLSVTLGFPGNKSKYPGRKKHKNRVSIFLSPQVFSVHLGCSTGICSGPTFFIFLRMINCHNFDYIIGRIYKKQLKCTQKRKRNTFLKANRPYLLFNCDV